MLQLPKIADEVFDDIDEIWAEYRQITKTGISKFTDDVIRDLYAKFSLLQSQAEIQLGIYEAKMASNIVKLSNLYATLLITKYKDVKSVSGKKLVTEADPEYLNLKEYCFADEKDFIYARQLAKAYATAAANLSRELTPRSKY